MLLLPGHHPKRPSIMTTLERWLLPVWLGRQYLSSCVVAEGKENPLGPVTLVEIGSCDHGCLGRRYKHPEPPAGRCRISPGSARRDLWCMVEMATTCHIRACTPNLLMHYSIRGPAHRTNMANGPTLVCGFPNVCLSLFIIVPSPFRPVRGCSGLRVIAGCTVPCFSSTRHFSARFDVILTKPLVVH